MIGDWICMLLGGEFKALFRSIVIFCLGALIGFIGMVFMLVWLLK